MVCFTAVNFAINRKSGRRSWRSWRHGSSGSWPTNGKSPTSKKCWRSDCKRSARISRRTWPSAVTRKRNRSPENSWNMNGKTYIHTYICVVYINLLHKHMPRAALGLYKLQAASWQFPCYYWFNADNRHFPRKNLKCYAFGIKNWFHWTCRSAQWKWNNHEKKEKMSRVLPWGFLLSRSISIIPAALPFHHRPPISILLLCRTFSGFW